jgi:hypothetical protein
MLEVESTKSVVTCFEINIYDSWSIEQDQLIVEINNKKYFVMSASISKSWEADALNSDWQYERIVRPAGEARLISVLKNGKAGNDYKNQIIYRNSLGGIFVHLFDAYDKEFVKIQSEQLVGAN